MLAPTYSIRLFSEMIFFKHHLTGDTRISRSSRETYIPHAFQPVGRKSIRRSRYEAGSTGETLTVDHFDEADVSVGDIFNIGEVVAQATYPRIPCGKVNFRMQHENAKTAMEDCGRSGVYLRILVPGLIHSSDQVVRAERAEHTFLISRLYELVIKNQSPTPQELESAKCNPAFKAKQISKWEQA